MLSMDVRELLDLLFPQGHRTSIEDWLVEGEADVEGETLAILGMAKDVFIGGGEALLLAEKLLDLAENHPGRNVLMLVQNQGQRMALEEELLVLPEYVAHLLKAQEAVRAGGGRLIGVIYGPAVAGGFIAYGLLADRIVAVPGAEPSVMKLEAISRVTKMPMEKLSELAKTVPVFAPGCEPFYRMGGIAEIWEDDFAGRLKSLLKSDLSEDIRAAQGLERGGRPCAYQVIEDVIHAS